MPRVVRQVLPHEHVKYREHLFALDADSRLLRFGFIVTDDMLDKICDSFEVNHSEHALFCIENADLEFIAVGHIAIKGEMELAFSVLKAYQGQGMGDLLMRRCIQWCRTHNILKGCMVCFTHNYAIRHLCAKHGIQFHSEHGESVARIKLEHAGLDTYISEITDSNFAVFDYFGKRLTISWAFNK